MSGTPATEQFETVVIGGGQAGLAAGYHLKRRGRGDFVILDASERVGDAWRNRWDSLRLFTSARYNGLPGLRFPAPPHYFPTKDEMADFLAHYAARFDLPVRSGIRVDGVARAESDGAGHRFSVTAGERRFEADNVIVAMSNYQEPWLPAFADELHADVVQIHSADYRNPGQLQPGRVLLVGGGNSAAEIAMELAPHHDVVMSGRDTGQIPFRIDGLPGRTLLVPLTLRGVFRHVLSISTPIGRAARPKAIRHGGPLIRTKNRHLAAAGVTRASRTAGVVDGMPLLDNGRVVEVENVVWCTGYRAGFERWIRLPVHGEVEPRHHGGVVHDEPGLYFVGLHFLRSLSSVMIQGVGRDAAHIVDAIDRETSRRSTRAPARAQTSAARDRETVVRDRETVGQSAG
jgi:putative flavoprotein involved in K+ transport